METAKWIGDFVVSLIANGDYCRISQTGVGKSPGFQTRKIEAVAMCHFNGEWVDDAGGVRAGAGGCATDFRAPDR